MKELTNTKIEQLVKKLNKCEKNEKTGVSKIHKTEIEEELKKNYFSKKAVLGIDIYRYSQYPLLEQTLIPYLFKRLYYTTIDNCLVNEPFLFPSITVENFNEYFIDRGDGGFQIFDTPFQALVFAIYFQANIKRYNCGKDFLKDTKNVVGEITLRYSLTYDDIYSYSHHIPKHVINNHYGPSIINNARIMAKDKLDRFLIDDNTVSWFNEEINGIENLQIINTDNFNRFNFLKQYKKKNNKIQTVLFKKIDKNILTVDLLKIGEIKSKFDTLSINNLHIQTVMSSGDNNSNGEIFTISLGNLNSEGITPTLQNL